ncbi:polysaccharide pyruvyl transferase family protein [Saccharopolyspora dendranthemae]|uniref:Polysaccharide pyruvyl transferase WcaK-like protein n=1 Tax=Saccharopolyspora dendranthemae TaxID=1181886 RepID=A0A561U2I3_9PSEU|nr:polysaccharide pyruvyl transferase family protein [Saccharopolyspora dendranthemae]TWF93556.1 polysaccharide pyruvyl transferase WcaK-like protein [Saccharopolyspora dendranthemae]
MKNPPRIYLVATTGNPNYGDELIAAAWLKHLAKVAPHSEIWLDSPNPGPSSVLLSHLHPNVKFTDTFWRLCWEAPEDEPWAVAAFAQHAIHNPGLAPRWVAGIELAAQMDLFHVIGGGFINGIWPRHIGLLAATAAAAHRSGGRAVMTGQGLSPVAEGAGALLRSLTEQFEVVDVRDEPSAAALVNPTVTGDDMFFGVESGLFRTDDDDVREVMICMQSDLLDESVPALAGFLLDTLREWRVKPEQVAFVEGIPRADREVFSLVEHDLPGARFHAFDEILREGLPARPGQRWLSTRFHLHLLAAAAGASGVAVSINSGYYTNKHRSLIERGSGWELSEGLRVPASPSGGGFSTAALRELQQRKAALAKSIYG